MSFHYCTHFTRTMREKKIDETCTYTEFHSLGVRVLCLDGNENFLLRKECEAETSKCGRKRSGYYPLDYIVNCKIIDAKISPFNIDAF